MKLLKKADFGILKKKIGKYIAVIKVMIEIVFQ
jgi:hypothetical protein